MAIPEAMAHSNSAEEANIQKYHVMTTTVVNHSPNDSIRMTKVAKCICQNGHAQDHRSSQNLSWEGGHY